MSQTPFAAEPQALAPRRPSPSRPWPTWLLLGLSLCLAGCGSRPSDTPVDSDLPPLDGPNVFPFCEAAPWGYINRSGEVVIEPDFWWAEDFHDGRARVSTQNGETAFINPQGAVVFTAPKSWEEVGHFSEGLAKFFDGNKWGYADAQGKAAIEPRFDDARGFSEGLAAVNLGAELEVVDEPPTAAFSIRRGGKWGFIDKTGRMVVECEFSSVGDFHDGVAWVRLPCGPGGRVGPDDRRFYIDKSGQPAFELADAVRGTGWWVNPSSFSEGLAVLSVWDPQDVNRERDGFIDTTGKFVIEPRFRWAKGFSEGLAAAADETTEGYIDHTGKMVITIPADVDVKWEFHDGVAAVEVGERWGFIDQQGEYAIPPDKHYRGLGPINEVEWPPRFRSGLARVHIGGTLHRVMDAPWFWTGGAWYYINRRGEIVHLYQRDPEL